MRCVSAHRGNRAVWRSPLDGLLSRATYPCRLSSPAFVRSFLGCPACVPIGAPAACPLALQKRIAMSLSSQHGRICLTRCSRSILRTFQPSTLGALSPALAVRSAPMLSKMPDAQSHHHWRERLSMQPRSIHHPLPLSGRAALRRSELAATIESMAGEPPRAGCHHSGEHHGFPAMRPPWAAWSSTHRLARTAQPPMSNKTLHAQ